MQTDLVTEYMEALRMAEHTDGVEVDNLCFEKGCGLVDAVNKGEIKDSLGLDLAMGFLEKQARESREKKAFKAGVKYATDAAKLCERVGDRGRAIVNYGEAGLYWEAARLCREVGDLRGVERYLGMLD